jgi:hypothetical protein
MTRLLSIALSTAAIGFFVSLTPVVAQVAGNRAIFMTGPCI